jgi:hypothetical protein
MINSKCPQDQQFLLETSFDPLNSEINRKDRKDCERRDEDVNSRKQKCPSTGLSSTRTEMHNTTDLPTTLRLLLKPRTGHIKPLDMFSITGSFCVHYVMPSRNKATILTHWYKASCFTRGNTKTVSVPKQHATQVRQRRSDSK